MKSMQTAITKMGHLFLIHLFFLSAVLDSASASYDSFVDNIPHKIIWPGNSLVVDDSSEALILITPGQEKYKCVLPSLHHLDQEEEISSYTGPSEMDLLDPLFQQTSCSYRIESYWTYELCHGKSLRQYHEEKDSNQKLKRQEYILGLHSLESPADLGEEEVVKQKEKERPKHVPTKKVEGLDVPYFELSFTDGTPCDLTGEPRRTSVQYVCQPDGAGEIYELKETFTCGYDLVVLAKQLCSHPLYRLKSDPVNEIQCHSLDGGPSKPKSLIDLEEEVKSPEWNRPPHSDPPAAKSTSGKTLSINSTPKSQGHSSTKSFASSTDKTPTKVQVSYKSASSPKQPATTSTISTASGWQVLQDFLAGDYCIHGGTGWWKHQICYGKHVQQYHKDKKSSVELSLGRWNKKKHQGWLAENPNKSPRYVSHYYSDGDICDLTGKPRETEVKLKCVNSPSQPTAISIYLLEPSACSYLLVVESQLFCNILEEADKDGILYPSKNPPPEQELPSPEQEELPEQEEPAN